MRWWWRPICCLWCYQHEGHPPNTWERNVWTQIDISLRINGERKYGMSKIMENEYKRESCLSHKKVNLFLRLTGISLFLDILLIMDHYELNQFTSFLLIHLSNTLKKVSTPFHICNLRHLDWSYGRMSIASLLVVV